MKKYTFRTEHECDNDRVPALLTAMGLTVETSSIINDPISPDYRMGVFSFLSPKELEELQLQMSVLIEEDEWFVDMHRCYQTLAEGSAPNETWSTHSHYRGNPDESHKNDHS